MLSRLLASACVVVSFVLVSAGSPATAADPNVTFLYSASAGATQIKALGTTVDSGMTAPSGVSGAAFPAQRTASVATVNVPGLAFAGALATKAAASGTASSPNVYATAKTADVNLLGGLLKVQALETLSQAWRAGDELAGQSGTKFVGLAIKDQTLPINIPKNFKIALPGIATIVLNESKVTINGGKVTSTAAAIRISLLTDLAGAAAGSTILVNPTSASIGVNVPFNATAVGGYAFGSKALLVIGDSSLQAAETAVVNLPSRGSGGFTTRNSTAAIRLSTALQAGVVESTSRGSSVPVTADVLHTNEVTRISLLNGIITADAVKVSAGVLKNSAGVVTLSGSTKLVNVKVAGTTIPLNVAPNTKISVPGVGTVIINQQVRTATRITVTGLHVILGQPNSGLKVGSDIRVAEAASWLG